MSVLSADIHRAVNSLWNSSGLDDLFTALWPSDITDSEFQVLNDGEAGPAQPMPYCVFEQGAGSTTARMSSRGSVIREIRDIPWEFRVHARAVSGDSRTAKEIAAYLIEEITKVYGGHPTDNPTALTLDNGNFLIAQYQNDYGIRTGDDEHEWIVGYLFRVDVPVAV